MVGGIEEERRGHNAMAQTRIVVVVLTWNHHHYTRACLRSLERQTAPHTVYVVDNASTDGTADIVAAEFPAVQVLRNTKNLGFASGNNVGIHAAFSEGADAVLVLNNDTTLESDALAELIAAARAHPEAGIINPLILFAQPPHRVWFAGAEVGTWTARSPLHGHNAPRTTIADAVRPIGRAAGTAMLITRACYERIGGFDDALFMYFEDVEYSLRARKAGLAILLAPRAIVYHHISVSTGGAKSPSSVYYNTRNGIVAMERHRPLPVVLAPVRRMLIALTMLLFVLRPPRAPARLRDLLDGYRDARRRSLGSRGAMADDA